MQGSEQQAKAEFYGDRYDAMRAEFEARLTDRIVERLAADAAQRDQTAWGIALVALLTTVGWSFNRQIYQAIGMEIGASEVFLVLFAYILLSRDRFSRMAHRRITRLAQRARTR